MADVTRCRVLVLWLTERYRVQQMIFVVLVLVRFNGRVDQLPPRRPVFGLSQGSRDIKSQYSLHLIGPARYLPLSDFFPFFAIMRLPFCSKHWLVDTVNSFIVVKLEKKNPGWKERGSAAIFARFQTNLQRVFDSKYQFKKLYIAITVFLFEACMNETSREAALEMCRRLQKHELQMILKVCQCLKAVDMTELNIEASIKAAFIETYGTAITRKLEGQKKEPDEEIVGVDPSCTRCGKTETGKTSSHELKTLLPPREAKDSELRIRSRIQTDSCPSSGLLEMDVNEDAPCMSYSFSSKTSLGPRFFGKKRGRSSSPSSSGDATKGSAYSVNNTEGVRWNLYCALGGMVLLAVVIVILCSLTLLDRGGEKTKDVELLDEYYNNTVKLKRLVREGFV
ncbi:hypothetical protein RR46_03071 [Papilio xuthus]|uniref:Uncharacterized protein n=1 Tax=Papilio xuthus TaxID=66420 RepID=A0A194Q884_PAPXU|nr:hypothetical protein RR46_03071 [Papilio xuthus]